MVNDPPPTSGYMNVDMRFISRVGMYLLRAILTAVTNDDFLVSSDIMIAFLKDIVEILFLITI